MAFVTFELSEQQVNILRYVIKGRSNEQIGDLLNISEKEVANYRKALMKNAGVKCNEELITWIKSNNVVV
jgi:DNA-binding NarL/FixJ family response regulator